MVVLKRIGFRTIFQRCFESKASILFNIVCLAILYKLCKRLLHMWGVTDAAEGFLSPNPPRMHSYRYIMHARTDTTGVKHFAICSLAHILAGVNVCSCQLTRSLLILPNTAEQAGRVLRPALAFCSHLKRRQDRSEMKWCRARSTTRRQAAASPPAQLLIVR